MAEETSAQTQGVQATYANVAGITISFHDVRIYLGEVAPSSVDFGVTQLKNPPPTFNVVGCVVASPEFARNLRDALTTSIEKYESVFGPLRPNPTNPPNPPAPVTLET
jgi:Protein of unknown function (DUF3467)